MAPLLVSAVVLYFRESLFLGNLTVWYHINKYRVVDRSRKLVD